MKNTQVACRREFEMRVAPKKPDSDLTIFHPNMYYTEMSKYLSIDDDGNTNKRKKEDHQEGKAEFSQSTSQKII